MSSSRFADLEARPFFRRTAWLRALFLALALVLNLLVLAFVACLHVDTEPNPRGVELMGYYVHLAYDAPKSYLLLAGVLAVQVWLGHRAFLASFDGEGMIQLYPEDKSGSRTFGGLTGPQLATMVHDLAAEMGVGPVRRVVINDRPDPNAYTAHILGTGNVVVLHANLLEILPPDGVKSVVAHEVGHMRRRDSLVYLLLNFPRMFLYVLGMFILWKIGLGILTFDTFTNLFSRLGFLAVVVGVSLLVVSRLNRIANLASQQSEHLADAYAACACGVEPMLNALLILGERGEALAVLQKALVEQAVIKEAGIDEAQLVRILRRFPPRELDQLKARALATRLYVEERLGHLRDKLCLPLTEEEIVDLARRADLALKQKEAEGEEPDEAEKKSKEEAIAKEAELEKLLIDWRKYDRDRSGHLDLQEMAALVAEMRADPKKMIFRQFLEDEAEWQSHPTMRHRVLYLYDAFEVGK